MNKIFKDCDRVIYEHYNNQKLVSLFLFNSNFQILNKILQYNNDSNDIIKIYNNSTLIEKLDCYFINNFNIISDYLVDLNKLNQTSYIKYIFKRDGIYITLNEAIRFLNNKIELGEIRDKFQEFSDAKTQEEYNIILNDCGIANYTK